MYCEGGIFLLSSSCGVAISRAEVSRHDAAWAGTDWVKTMMKGTEINLFEKNQIKDFTNKTIGRLVTYIRFAFSGC